MYGKEDPDTYHYLKKLRFILDRFNEKYPDISVAVKKTFLNIHLRFFVKKTTMNEVFEEFPFQDSFKKRIFGNEKNNVDVNVEFADDNKKTYSHVVEDTLALKKNYERNAVEIIYRDDTLDNPNSAEFLLLAKNALSMNFNKEINIKARKDDIFCFDLDDEGSLEKGIVYCPKENSGVVEY
jgi:hypothetical protein